MGRIQILISSAISLLVVIAPIESHYETGSKLLAFMLACTFLILTFISVFLWVSRTIFESRENRFRKQISEAFF
jgi:hypothetical protein